MIEVINQFYSMNLAMETRKGLNENASRGFQNGGVAPYGYQRKKIEDGTAIRNILVPGDPREVETVKRIFDLATNKGLGHIQICNILNQEKIPGPGRSKQWSRSSVHHILNNETYIGRLIWNKSSGGKRNPREKMIIVDDAHEAIIDKETFEKFKKTVKKRDFTNFKNEFHYAKYLLGNLIFCKDCGAKYVGRKQKITLRGKKTKGKFYYNHYYICGGYIRNGKEACSSFQIKRDLIEKEVLKLLRKNVCTPETMREIKDAFEKKIKERRNRFGKDSEFLKRRLGTIEKKIENYYAAIGEKLNPAKCKEIIASLEKEREELLSEVQIVEQEDYFESVMREGFGLVERRAMSVYKNFREQPFEDQRTVVEFFIRRIEIVDRAKTRIIFEVPFEDKLDKLTEPEAEIDFSGNNSEGAEKSALSANQTAHVADVAGSCGVNEKIVRDSVYLQRTIQLPGSDSNHSPIG